MTGGTLECGSSAHGWFLLSGDTVHYDHCLVFLPQCPQLQFKPRGKTGATITYGPCCVWQIAYSSWGTEWGSPLLADPVDLIVQVAACALSAGFHGLQALSPTHTAPTSCACTSGIFHMQPR